MALVIICFINIENLTPYTMTANQTGPAGCLVPEADYRSQAIVLALCRTPILSPWPRSQAHKFTPHKPCHTSLHHPPNHQSQTT